MDVPSLSPVPKLKRKLSGRRRARRKPASSGMKRTPSKVRLSKRRDKHKAAPTITGQLDDSVEFEALMDTLSGAEKPTTVVPCLADVDGTNLSDAAGDLLSIGDFVMLNLDVNPTTNTASTSTPFLSVHLHGLPNLDAEPSVQARCRVEVSPEDGSQSTGRPFHINTLFQLVHYQKFGSYLRYGGEVQLRHVHSGQLVAWHRRLANLRCLECVLVDDDPIESVFRVLPRFDFRSEGEIVRAGDPFVLVSAEGMSQTAMYLHASTEEELVEASMVEAAAAASAAPSSSAGAIPPPLPPLPGSVGGKSASATSTRTAEELRRLRMQQYEERSWELNVSVNPSVWKMQLFRNWDEVQRTDCVRFGDLVRLFHRENAAYLFAAGPGHTAKGRASPFGLAQLRVVEANAPEVYTDGHSKGVDPRRRTLPSPLELGSGWDLWRVVAPSQALDASGAHTGRLMRWDEPFHLCHVTTGRYLCALPALRSKDAEYADDEVWGTEAEASEMSLFQFKSLSVEDAQARSEEQFVYYKGLTRLQNVHTKRFLSSENEVKWYERGHVNLTGRPDNSNGAAMQSSRDRLAQVAKGLDLRFQSLDASSVSLDEEVFEVQSVGHAAEHSYFFVWTRVSVLLRLTHCLRETLRSEDRRKGKFLAEMLDGVMAHQAEAALQDLGRFCTRSNVHDIAQRRGFAITTHQELLRVLHAVTVVANLTATVCQIMFEARAAERRRPDHDRAGPQLGQVVQRLGAFISLCFHFLSLAIWHNSEMQLHISKLPIVLVKEQRVVTFSKFQDHLLGLDKIWARKSLKLIGDMYRGNPLLLEHLGERDIQHYLMLVWRAIDDDPNNDAFTVGRNTALPKDFFDSLHINTDILIDLPQILTSFCSIDDSRGVFKNQNFILKLIQKQPALESLILRTENDRVLVGDDEHAFFSDVCSKELDDDLDIADGAEDVLDVSFSNNSNVYAQRRSVLKRLEFVCALVRGPNQAVARYLREHLREDGNEFFSLESLLNVVSHPGISYFVKSHCLELLEALWVDGMGLIDQRTVSKWSDEPDYGEHLSCTRPDHRECLRVFVSSELIPMMEPGAAAGSEAPSTSLATAAYAAALFRLLGAMVRNNWFGAEWRITSDEEEIVDGGCCHGLLCNCSSKTKTKRHISSLPLRRIVTKIAGILVMTRPQSQDDLSVTEVNVIAGGVKKQMCGVMVSVARLVVRTRARQYLDEVQRVHTDRDSASSEEGERVSLRSHRTASMVVDEGNAEAAQQAQQLHIDYLVKLCHEFGTEYEARNQDAEDEGDDEDDSDFEEEDDDHGLLSQMKKGVSAVSSVVHEVKGVASTVVAQGANLLGTKSTRDRPSLFPSTLTSELMDLLMYDNDDLAAAAGNLIAIIANPCIEFDYMVDKLRYAGQASPATEDADGPPSLQPNEDIDSEEERGDGLADLRAGAIREGNEDNNDSDDEHKADDSDGESTLPRVVSGEGASMASPETQSRTKLYRVLQESVMRWWDIVARVSGVGDNSDLVPAAVDSAVDVITKVTGELLRIRETIADPKHAEHNSFIRTSLLELDCISLVHLMYDSAALDLNELYSGSTSTTFHTEGPESPTMATIERSQPDSATRKRVCHALETLYLFLDFALEADHPLMASFARSVNVPRLVSHCAVTPLAALVLVRVLHALPSLSSRVSNEDMLRLVDAYANLRTTNFARASKWPGFLRRLQLVGQPPSWYVRIFLILVRPHRDRPPITRRQTELFVRLIQLERVNVSIAPFRKSESDDLMAEANHGDHDEVLPADGSVDLKERRELLHLLALCASGRNCIVELRCQELLHIGKLLKFVQTAPMNESTVAMKRAVLSVFHEVFVYTSRDADVQYSYFFNDLIDLLEVLDDELGMLVDAFSWSGEAWALTNVEFFQYTLDLLPVLITDLFHALEEDMEAFSPDMPVIRDPPQGIGRLGTFSRIDVERLPGVAMRLIDRFKSIVILASQSGVPPVYNPRKVSIDVELSMQYGVSRKTLLQNVCATEVRLLTKGALRGNLGYSRPDLTSIFHARLRRVATCVTTMFQIVDARLEEGHRRTYRTTTKAINGGIKRLLMSRNGAAAAGGSSTGQDTGSIRSVMARMSSSMSQPPARLVEYLSEHLEVLASGLEAFGDDALAEDFELGMFLQSGSGSDVAHSKSGCLGCVTNLISKVCHCFAPDAVRVGTTAGAGTGAGTSAADPLVGLPATSSSVEMTRSPSLGAPTRLTSRSGPVVTGPDVVEDPFLRAKTVIREAVEYIGRDVTGESQVVFKSHLLNAVIHVISHYQRLKAAHVELVGATGPEDEADEPEVDMLTRMQHVLVRLGFPQLLMQLIVRSRRDSNLEYVAWRAATKLLAEGNREVQEAYLQLFQTQLGRELFEVIKMHIRRFSWEVKNAADSRSQGNSPLHSKESVRTLRTVLRFLKDCCENHFTPMQEFLGSSSSRSANMVSEVRDLFSEFSSELAMSIVDTRAPMTEQSLELARHMLDTLTEFVQGPCLLNQQVLSKNSVLMRAVNQLILAFNRRTEQRLAQHTAAVEQKLRSDQGFFDNFMARRPSDHASRRSSAKRMSAFAARGSVTINGNNRMFNDHPKEVSPRARTMMAGGGGGGGGRGGGGGKGGGGGGIGGDGGPLLARTMTGVQNRRLSTMALAGEAGANLPGGLTQAERIVTEELQAGFVPSEYTVHWGCESCGDLPEEELSLAQRLKAGVSGLVSKVLTTKDDHGLDLRFDTPCRHYLCEECTPSAESDDRDCPQCDLNKLEASTYQFLLGLIEGATNKSDAVFRSLMNHLSHPVLLRRIDFHNKYWEHHHSIHSQNTVLLFALWTNIADHPHVQQFPSGMEWKTSFMRWRKSSNLERRILHPEIVNANGEVERIFFQVPRMVFDHYKRSEVTSLQQDILENRSVKGPEERLKSFMKRSDELITAVRHMKRLSDLRGFWTPLIWIVWRKPWPWWIPSFLIAMVTNVLLIMFGELEDPQYSPIGGDGKTSLTSGSFDPWYFGDDDTLEWWIWGLSWLHLLFAILMTLEFAFADGFLIVHRNYHRPHGGNPLTVRVVNPRSFKDSADLSLDRDSQLAASVNEGRRWMMRLLKSFISPYPLYYMLYITASILAVVHSPYWNCVFLFDYVLRNTTVMYVVRAVTSRLGQMMATVLLGLFMLYAYAVVAFVYFPTQFSFGGDQAMYDCATLLDCVQLHFDAGFRATPWFHNEFPTIDDGNGANTPRSQVDLPSFGFPFFVPLFTVTFFVMVNVVIVSIITGIIIDTFSEMRSNREEIARHASTYCFVCNINRDTFDEHGHGFKMHVAVEHNMWAYVWLKAYLRRKHKDSRTEMTGLETYCYERMLSGTISFLPLRKALTLPEAHHTSPEEEDED